MPRSAYLSRALRSLWLPLAAMLALLPALAQASVSIHVNAGGPAFTDANGVTWAADMAPGNGTTFDWGNATIAGAADTTLYRTERYGSELHYSFAVPNGTYRVKLHFAENYFNSGWPNGGIGQRLFNVQLEGVTALSNVDVLALAGAHTANVQTLNTTVADGQLNVDLYAIANNAEINGIEVDMAGVDTTPPTVPTGLQASSLNSYALLVTWTASTDAGTGVGGYNVYRNGAFIGVADTSGATPRFVDYSIAPNTSYTYTVTATDNASPPNESLPSVPLTVTSPTPVTGGGALYRINVGGPAVVDSLGNAWTADAHFNTGTVIDWAAAGAADIAGSPYAVLFRTERFAPANGPELRYDLPVPNGTYDLRLYFAERWVTGPGQRLFATRIENAQDGTHVFPTDIYAATGGRDRPLILQDREIVTDGFVHIHFVPSIENPFLNAIEVLPAGAGVPDADPPTVPAIVSAQVQGTSNVQLGWSLAVDQGVGVAGYRLRRSGTLVATTDRFTQNYLDSGLTPGSTYLYTVSAFDFSGNESAQSSPTSVALPATNCPPRPTPTGLAVTNVASRSVSLSWNPVSDNCPGANATLLVNKRAGGVAPGSTVGTLAVSATQFVVPNLDPATSYTFVVTYCRYVQDEQPCGTPATVTVTTLSDPSLPPPPTNVSVTALGGKSVLISWNSAAVGVPPTYAICRHSGSLLVNLGFDEFIGVANGSSFLDTGVLPTSLYGYRLVPTNASSPAACNPGNDAPYYFVTMLADDPSTGAVWRINAGGGSYTDSAGYDWVADFGYSASSSSAWGNVHPATGTNDWQLYATERYAPALHYALPVANGNYRVKLHFAEHYFDGSWPNGGVGLRRFDIRLEGQTAFSNLDVLATVGAHAALIESFDTAVSDGSLDIDLVASANNAFVDAIEVLSLSGAAQDTTPPGIPIGLGATPVSDTSIRLIWSPATDSGTGVGGYHVWRNGAQVASVAAGGLLQYTDAGLAPATTYSYTVSAYDRASPVNESAQSAPVTGATLAGAGVPTTPSLQGTAVSTRMVKLTWGASTDDQGIDGYRLYRDGTLIATLPQGGSSGTYSGIPYYVYPFIYFDTGVQPGSQHSYAIESFDVSVPSNASPRSAPVPVTTPGEGQVVKRINAAGPLYVDSNGRTWEADNGFTGGTTLDYGPLDIHSTSDPTLFETERYGKSFSYDWYVPNGTYRVNLYMAENYFNSTFLCGQIYAPAGGFGANCRTVSVTSGASSVYANLLPSVGSRTAWVASMDVQVTDGHLGLLFAGGYDNALVNAIEVISLAQ